MSEAASASASTAAATGTGEAQATTQSAAETAALGNVSKAAREYYEKNVTAPAAAQQTNGEPPAAGDNAAQPDGEGAQQTKKTFDELLADEDYKKEYDTRVQNAVSKRFKSAKASEERMAKITPLLDLLGRKYGVDTSDLDKLDIEGLVKTVTEDDSYYEEEAAEKGMSVESLKAIHKVESENQQLRRAEAQRLQAAKDAEDVRQFNQLMNAMRQRGEEVKKAFPNFDFDTEMQNEGFRRLVFTPGVDLQQAYIAVHSTEILGGAMTHAAQQTKAQVAASIAGGNQRPAENGTGSAAPAQTKIDVATLSKEQRQEYIRRAARGEMITFT